MLDKRPLLESNDDDDDDDIRQAKETAVLGGIPYKSPILLWYLRQILHRRKLFLLLIGIFVCSYLIIGPANVFEMDNILQVHHRSGVQDMEGYLVYSNNCRIKDLNPYTHEIMMHYKPVPYQKCKSHSPLTQVDYDEKTQHYELKIDKKALESYSTESSLNCCYMGVVRIDDDRVNYTSCRKLKSRAQVANTTDGIIVKCSAAQKQVYINGHAMVPERTKVRQRLTQWASHDADRRVPSVLMIGIDSVSRLNLIRAMPKTAQYLYDNDWFELAGYNKVDDNTFPNLMAVLTGYNMSTATKKCNPYNKNSLDKCKFIWNLFQEHGYVTAYAEDAVRINTFNYLKKGFGRPPTDYYLRPYLAAAEKLLDLTVFVGLPHCLGFETESEKIYSYAQEFAHRYRNDSFFGFFWTNTHSHSDISQTSSMDDYLKDYLQRLVAQGTMENSIVVFFSDHGMRFGPTRSTWTGHYEERLPFLFIWLPQYMREAHPEFVEALRENRNRLTTPYDLYITLQHILEISGRTSSIESLGGAKDCPECQSLLKPVPPNRRCMDVGIVDHWCTCWSFIRISRNSQRVKHVGKSLVQYLNNYIASFRNGTMGHLCETLSLLNVVTAYQADPKEAIANGQEIYLLHFTTMPNKAMFEATATYDESLPDNKNVRVSGSVSRLDYYGSQSSCMIDVAIKKYCMCKKNARKEKT